MKKIICFIIILFFMVGYVNASDYQTNVGNNTEGYIRSISNNYGVNKKWKVTNNNKSNVLKTPYVNPSYKIYDFVDILTDQEELIIKEKIDNFINESNMDLVIVTIDMPYINDEENETYASDFYDYNDFGIDFKKYSGVLLLRNTFSEDPYFNIYTFGEAQIYFDYDRCEKMLDDLYPFFRNKNYLNGIIPFIDSLQTYYRKGYSTNQYYVDSDGFIKEKFIPPYGVGITISGIISLLTVGSMKRRNKMVSISDNADDYLDKRSINYSSKDDNLVSSFTTHHIISSSTSGSSSHSGSFHSGIGSSGGGHSSGGGRHG